MANEESILGLLLRAYGQCCAQEHGEQYLHHNDNAAAEYRIAVKHIYDAINSVVIAEVHVRIQETRKAFVKESEKRRADAEAAINGKSDRVSES